MENFEKTQGRKRHGDQKHLHETKPIGSLFLPNEIFTLGLSSGELSIYIYLVFCEDRENHQCWPSIGNICRHTDMSTNTVAKYR